MHISFTMKLDEIFCLLCFTKFHSTFSDFVISSSQTEVPNTRKRNPWCYWRFQMGSIRKYLLFSIVIIITNKYLTIPPFLWLLWIFWTCSYSTVSSSWFLEGLVKWPSWIIALPSLGMIWLLPGQNRTFFSTSMHGSGIATNSSWTSGFCYLWRSCKMTSWICHWSCSSLCHLFHIQFIIFLVFTRIRIMDKRNTPRDLSNCYNTEFNTSK